jgi:hypothetical protein
MLQLHASPLNLVLAVRACAPALLLVGGIVGCGAEDEDAGSDLVDSGASADVGTNLDTTPALPARFIFVSTEVYAGDLGGLSGADERCNTDPARPSEARYRALLVSDSRTACETDRCSGDPGEHDSWVLRPGTQYVTAEGLPVFETGSAGVPEFPFAGALTTDDVVFWSGLEYGLQTRSEELCGNWSSDSDTLRGGIGRARATDTAWLNDGFLDCSRTAHLICVEQ